MTTPNELRAIAERLRKPWFTNSSAELHRQAADAITSLLADLEAAEARVEEAFREGFALGDFAGGGQADPRTVNLAWNNSRARTALANPTEEKP